MATSSFTHNGDYFALLSVDGRLRIWDTTSGKVVQEFSSNAAAQSSCTCVCWTRRTFSRGEQKKLKRKQKKKNEKLGNGVGSLFPSIAIGTDKGFLFCYNPITGEIEKINNDGHIDKINCVVYHEKRDVLYTCSEDKYIAEWCLKSHQIKSKWKADKRAVKRICIGPGGTSLLSAGNSIKLWNLDTKELLQRFNGHSSPISFLRFSPYKQNVKNGCGDDGYYFVSGSTADRVINAWQVNSRNPEVMAVATFVISDVPLFMDIILNEDGDKPLNLCVGCKDGRIHFFTCTMNGRTSKPIESSKTLDYLLKENAANSPVPFINGRLYKQNGVNLSLVYGQVLNLSFSSLCYDELDVSSRIEKDLKKNLLMSELVQENDSSIELATTNRSAKFIFDTTASVLPVTVDNQGQSHVAVGMMNGDVQKTDMPGDELSMEERLKAESGSKKFLVKMKPKKASPNAGSFAQMLIQALHSNDEKMICEMLFNNNFSKTVLQNTIKRVPNKLVEKLLRIITDMLLWNPNRSSYLIQWLRTVMSVHLTFLLSSEISKEALAGLYRLVKTQEEIHMPLLNLRGKIDMVLSYVSGNTESDDDDEDLTTAAITYDDSSDETDEPLAKVKKNGKEGKEVKKIADSEASDDDTDALKIDTDGNTETDVDNETDRTLSGHSDQEIEEG